MAIKANLVIDQGTDYSATIDLVDDNNTIFNLTGYSVRAQVRKSYAATTSYNFTATHNGTSGQIILFMSNGLTQTMEPGRYLYDVEITSPGNSITRVVEGIVTVTPGITRI
jgi:predicted flavoprotein YhiN